MDNVGSGLGRGQLETVLEKGPGKSKDPSEEEKMKQGYTVPQGTPLLGHPLLGWKGPPFMLGETHRTTTALGPAAHGTT